MQIDQKVDKKKGKGIDQKILFRKKWEACKKVWTVN